MNSRKILFDVLRAAGLDDEPATELSTLQPPPGGSWTTEVLNSGKVDEIKFATELAGAFQAPFESIETDRIERKALGLPPYTHLALLAAEAKREASLSAFLSVAARLGRALVAADDFECEVFSPVAAAMPRRAGISRAQVLVQSANRKSLQAFLARWRHELERIDRRAVRWALDVDPLGFA